MVAVGNSWADSAETMEKFYDEIGESGKTSIGFIFKGNNPSKCQQTSVYSEFKTPANLQYEESDVDGCEYQWITKVSTPGKRTGMEWIAESPDGKYFIAVGIEQDDAVFAN